MFAEKKGLGSMFSKVRPSQKTLIQSDVKKFFLVMFLHENSCWIVMKNVPVSRFLKAISLW